MAPPLPKPPGNLHPLARELLESLAGHAEGAEIVIGGGVALSHYLEYRPTVDLDAWWHEEPRADVVAFLEAAMQALASQWEPVCIETLRDNVASKMAALVQRGAPRDFLDIYQVCTRDVMSMADCWRAFTDKDLGVGSDEAKRKIIARLAMIEASRPLATIQPGEVRDQAARVREWYYGVFAAPAP